MTTGKKSSFQQVFEVNAGEFAVEYRDLGNGDYEVRARGNPVTLKANGLGNPWTIRKFKGGCLSVTLPSSVFHLAVAHATGTILRIKEIPEYPVSNDDLDYYEANQHQLSLCGSPSCKMCSRLTNIGVAICQAEDPEWQVSLTEISHFELPNDYPYTNEELDWYVDRAEIDTPSSKECGCAACSKFHKMTQKMMEYEDPKWWMHKLDPPVMLTDLIDVSKSECGLDGVKDRPIFGLFFDADYEVRMYYNENDWYWIPTNIFYNINKIGMKFTVSENIKNDDLDDTYIGMPETGDENEPETEDY